MDIKYSKTKSILVLFVSIAGFIFLPAFGVETWNNELKQQLSLLLFMPENYAPFVTLPILYIGLIACVIGINKSWKRIFNSNVVMRINKDGFWADLDNKIHVDLRWDEIESFRFKVRKIQRTYYEYLVINPKDINIAQRINRLSGHDSSTAASFMKWTKKTLGKAATAGIYDPHTQIAIYLYGFQYKPEKIIMKMEEYFEENK